MFVVSVWLIKVPVQTAVIIVVPVPSVHSLTNEFNDLICAVLPLLTLELKSLREVNIE
jgi:hypothetical protein